MGLLKFTIGSRERLKLVNKEVLLISPEDWGDCWVSKHHYALELAQRGNRVFFLNRSCAPVAVVSPHENLTILPAPRFPRGLWYFPAFLRRRVHSSALKSLESMIGKGFDLIWSFDGVRFLDLESEVTGCTTIFHLVDLTPGIPWKLPARSADFCLGVSLGLVEELKRYNPSTHFLQHGFHDVSPVDFDFKTGSPNAVYAGNLGHRSLDHVRVLALVDAYPDVSFHFFGDDGTGNLGTGRRVELADQLSKRSNCSLHGAVSPELLASIYRSADALIVAHKPAFDQIGNPHKFMEYLASGTPILSTKLREYESLSQEILFEDEVESYVAGFRALLEGAYRNGREKRQSYARDHAYPRQLDRIEGWLSSNALA